MAPRADRARDSGQLRPNLDRISATQHAQPMAFDQILPGR